MTTDTQTTSFKDLETLLQEVDEFEEFTYAEEDQERGPAQALHWEDDWDADEIDQDFADRLEDARVAAIAASK